MATQLQLQHFAVLDISYFVCVNYVTITCLTNNPCHLFCYATWTVPQKHSTSITRRGVNLPWGAYWCFVAFEPIEQDEPGDTLTHTFQLPGWPLKRIRWFSFRGTVNDILSPSVSAIFKFQPLTHTLWRNGAFDTWPDPNTPPSPWLYESAGPGSSRFVRETVITDTPPYSAKLLGVGWLQTTRFRQRFCASNFADKMVTCRIRFKRVGQGYYNIGLRINAISGANRWTTGNPSSRWQTYIWSGYVSPDVTWAQVIVGHLSRHATTEGGFVFDSVNFSWPI